MRRIHVEYTEAMVARAKTHRKTSSNEVPPEAVAAAIVRAIDKDLPEVFVTVSQARPAMALRALFPRFAAWLSRTLGMTSYLKELSSHVAQT